MLDRGKPVEKSALDIGCGPGSNAALFKGWDYLGIDFNEDYIERARTKFSDLKFEVANATEFESDRRFAVILVNSLMHHLDDNQCSLLLASASRLLAENGCVIVQEPIRASEHRPLQKFLMNQDRGEYFRSEEQWRAIFNTGGFSVAAEDRYDMKLANLVVGWQMYSVLLIR
jgi:trans-aconitate methyltransferase